MLKTPREGTIVRMMWDRLQTASPEKPARWGDFEAIYAANSDSHRKHFAMNISRFLSKYAYKVSRGAYINKLHKRPDFDRSFGSPEIADMAWTGKKVETVSVPLDLNEDAMVSVIKVLLDRTDADDELRELLVEAGRLHSRSMKNLQDAAVNYGKVDAHLEELLNRVRGLKRK